METTDFTVVGAAVEPRPTRTAPLPASEALFTSGCEPYCRHITPQAHFPEDKGFVKVASRLCGQGLAGDLPGGTLPGPAPHRTPGSPRRAGAPPQLRLHPELPRRGRGGPGLWREVAREAPGAGSAGAGCPPPAPGRPGDRRGLIPAPEGALCRRLYKPTSPSVCLIPSGLRRLSVFNRLLTGAPGRARGPPLRRQGLQANLPLREDPGGASAPQARAGWAGVWLYAAQACDASRVHLQKTGALRVLPSRLLRRPNKERVLCTSAPSERRL